MKNIITIILVGVLMVLGCISICGCSDSDAEINETYILYAGHDNQTLIDESDLRSRIEEAASIPENKITLVSIEGHPLTFNTYKIPQSGFLLLPSQKEKKAKSYAEEIMNDIAVIQPVTAECDYAAAFNSICNNMSSGTKASVIIKGSGLSTKGIVDYKSGLITREPETIVDNLIENDSLPRGGKIQQVFWIGCGQVTAPQEALSEKQYRNLEAFWKCFLEKSGAKKVEIKKGQARSAGEVKRVLPKVTTVDLPDEEIEITEVDNSLSITEKDANIIGEGIVSFVADTASFTNLNEANRIAKCFAKQMKESEWVVAAFTAGDEQNNYCLLLSKKRAEAFCALLVKNGVSENNITALGCGTGIGTQYTVRGMGTGSEASVNRICILVKKNSAAGEDLLKKYTNN